MTSHSPTPRARLKAALAAFLLIILGLASTAAAQQMTGTLNIPGDYASLAAAVTDLNVRGVAPGGVVLNLVAGNPQTAPAGGYVVGGSGSAVLTSANATAQVTIQGNGNTITAYTPQVSGTLTDAIFKLVGADWVTITGFTMQENPANATTAAATNNMTEWAVALLYASTTDGAQNNTIQGNTISLNRAYTNTWGVYSNVRHSATAIATTADITNATTAPNSGNKVYGNAISNVNMGIAFIGSGTAANQDVGNDVGGSSAATGNTITNWGGAAAVSGYISNSGTSYGIFMNHQVGDNVAYNTLTSAAVSGTAVTFRGIFKDYTTTAPVGTFTSNITNNTVTMTSGFTSGTFEAIRSQGMTALATATLNINNNTVLNCAVTGAASSSAITGIVNSSAPGTLSLSGNIIRGTTSTATTGGFTGVSNTGAVAGTININNNQVGNASGGAITFSAATSGALNGITNSGGAATAALSMSGNDIRGITHSLAGTSAHTYVINSAATLSQNISNNTFTNLNVNTTGSVTFLSDSVTAPAGGTKTVNGNSIVTAFNKGGAGGTVTLYTDNASSVAGVIVNNNNNNFSNLAVTGAAVIAGWSNTDGGAPTKTIQGNTFSNWTGGTGSVTALNVNFGTASVVTVAGNTVSGITGAGAITGIVLGSSIGTVNVTGNAVYSLASTGIAAVQGITTASTTANLGKNRIYDLSGSNASSTVNGLLVSAGTTVTAANNLIGDLRAPAATATGDVVRGISLTSSTTLSTINLYHNSIYLNASSSGANFSTSGIYHTTSTTATTAALNMRNNIVTNLSTPSGTGVTAAYRRSFNTITNYATGSNNNLFSAGAPAPNRLVYYDGTNSDQTLGAFQARVTPREANSISESPPFLSTTGSNPGFLHINPVIGTQVESAGQALAAVTDDIDGDARNASTPDLGADEGNFTLADLSGPAIAYATLANTATLGARTLTATITDASGVPVTGAGLPVLYWKINAGSWSAATAASLGGNQYQFSFGAGAVYPDVVSYYVAAQDNAGTPNVSANPFAGAAGFTVNPPAAATPPTTPNTYAILGAIAGTFTVGTGANYATLTAAVIDLNSKVVSGPVTFLLNDATYATETYPITINANGGLSAANPLTIRPNTGVTAALSGTSATALIVVNGADYVTIDGSNSGGSSRDLTLTNTGTGTTSAVVWAQTAGGTDPVTYSSFRNLNLAGSGNTQTLFGIGLGASAISTASLGAGNSYNTVQNCSISKTQYGIYSQGASSAAKNTGNVFTQNLMNTASPNNVARGGIWLGFENAVQVTQNTISGMSLAGSPDAVGIALGLSAISTTTFTGNEVTNATVARNNIGTVVNTGTYSAAGIAVASAASGTNLIANNLVSGVSANGTSGDFGAGIILGGGAGSTTQAYYNTVSMSGTQTGGGYPNIALAIGGTTPVVDVRNNILSNTQVTGTGTSYAIGLAYSGTAGNYANLTSNNNDLYVSTGATFATGVTGGLSGTARATLAAWNTETGRDAPGVSVATAAPFVSTTDLHLVPGATTLLESGGTPIAAVTNDYDNDPRSATTPDIGADEFAGSLFVANDMAATAFIDPTNGGSKSVGVAFAPQASFTNIGTAAQAGVTVRYRIVGPSPAITEVYNATATIASIPGSGVATVTFPSATLGAGGSYAIYASAELAGDQAAGNDQITGTVSALTPMSGTYLVGVTAFNELAGTNLTFEPQVRKVTREVLEPVEQQAQMSGDKSSTDVFLADRIEWKTVTREVEETVWVPMQNGQKFVRDLRVSRLENAGLPDWAMAGAYATITAAVADLNARGVSGPVQFLLTDPSYPTESFPITVNVAAGAPTAANTVTFKPNAGVTATVSGASASGALFKILNTNYVAIDGSNVTDGTSRDLTLENTSATSPTVVWFGSAGTNPLTGDKLANCVVRNGVATSSAVVISDGTTAGNAGYFSNLEVRNNRIEKAYIGVYANGGTTPANGSGLTYAGNQLDTSGANAIRLVGLYMQGVNGATVTGNTLGNFENATAENDIGIWLATGTTNAVVSGNTVTNLGSTSSSAYAPIGIDITSGVAGANVNVAQNTVTNISTSGTTAVRGIASPIAATADVVIQRNNVHGITNNNTSTYGSYGIDIAAGNNHSLLNNFVSDVRHNMTGGAAFSTTYGVFGIRIASGSGHVVAGNSVNLYGALTGTASSSLLSSALCVVSSASTGCDIRDNLLADKLTGGTTSVAHVSAYLPSGATSAMGLNWNNNAYYCGTTSASQGIAQVGSTAGTGFYVPGNFDPANTTPATNLRAYTSALSPAGDDDNASVASTAVVPFVDSTDLHVRTDMLSPVSNAGVAMASVTTDFDGEARLATPDIGADEFTIYTLATSVIGSGSVAVSPEQTAFAPGTTVTLTATPADACQLFTGWSGGATGTTNPLTIVMDGNKAITATFAPKTGTITATAGPGGSISPAGATVVACGGSQAYTITAESCFNIADVLVDGVSVGAVASYTFTGVSADHTIAASFIQKAYTITATAGAGGAISPTGAVAAAWGVDKTFTITAEPCFDVADVLVDGVSVGAVTSYTFTGVSADHTIAASFAAKTYTITATAGPGGSITPAGAVVVGCGADQGFAIAADPGSSLVDVLVDGVSVGAVTSYTFTGVAADHTIAASFSGITYTITASAGTGGAISPTGAVAVAWGADKTFAITAEPCFDVADVLVDGASVGAVASYTFLNVTGDHTIVASFAAKTYTITASAGPGGSITPAGAVVVGCGADQGFAIAADPGSSLVDVLVDGVSVGAVASYTFTGVSADHTIAASFSTIMYTITASAGTGGAISPAGAVAVAWGTDKTFAITADGCYDIADVVVDGASVGAVASYTFLNVTGDHTIAASFVAKTYTITATAGAGGTITPSGAVVVACGADQAFTIAPTGGLSIVDVVVDGTSVGAVGSYTFTGVSANHTITATFADTQCPDVTVVSPNGGEILIIAVAANLTWTAGDNVAVTCVDLELSRSSVAGPYETIASCVPNTGTYSWLVTGPAADHAYLKVVAHDAAGNACEDVSDASFEIVEQGVAVELRQFVARSNDAGVEIHWQLSEMVPFVRTDVERSDAAQGPFQALAETARQAVDEFVLLDSTAQAGRTYWYRLSGQTTGGQTITFEAVSATAGSPIAEFALKCVGPNPTHDVSRLSFAVPHPSHVRVTVIDLRGRVIATLADREFGIGRYEVSWNGESASGRVAAGMYMIRLEAPGKNLVQRVMMVH